MNYSNMQVVFQEVPHHISLAFSMSGCKIGCTGCHSTETWDSSYGIELSSSTLVEILSKYRSMISCVLFYGGEWEPVELIKLLDLVIEHGLHTCLYTGLELNQILPSIQSKLSYIKVGKYIKELGGLDSVTTNQKFYRITNENGIFSYTNLTKEFRK